MVKADKETKTGMIRGYLMELIAKGELNLDESVSNARIREIARELRDRYGVDFNVNTISTVIRELRVANSLNNGVKSEDESAEAKSEDESVEAEPKGEGGHGVWTVIGILVVVAVSVVVVLGLFGNRVRSLFGSSQNQSQGGNAQYVHPVSS